MHFDILWQIGQFKKIRLIEPGTTWRLSRLVTSEYSLKTGWKRSWNVLYMYFFFKYFKGLRNSAWPKLKRKLLFYVININYISIVQFQHLASSKPEKFFRDNKDQVAGPLGQCWAQYCCWFMLTAMDLFGFSIQLSE